MGPKAHFTKRVGHPRAHACLIPKKSWGRNIHQTRDREPIYMVICLYDLYMLLLMIMIIITILVVMVVILLLLIFMVMIVMLHGRTWARDKGIVWGKLINVFLMGSACFWLIHNKSMLKRNPALCMVYGFRFATLSLDLCGDVLHH